MKNHPFHLVDYSPWPLVGSLGVLTVTSGLVNYFYNLNLFLFFIGVLVVLLTMYQWWRDIIRESTFMGFHTSFVVIMMKFGMVLFILSEVMFFLSFFWGFFHSSLCPSVDIGLQWPPLGIKVFNPMNIPMLNTIILLSSGMTMTWSHNSLLIMNYHDMVLGLFLTVFLGGYFSLLQLYEYIESPFCISDSVYGSSFFMSTGFHGFHVIIGTVFIMIIFFRGLNLHFSCFHHVGFEASSWYWHFVDLVWLFLYLSVYWWGS
uniref:Cytochrome c oxidase subunit 3 n=1 Tax=Petalocephala chlorophana TaxID=2501810 RepID=A0A7L8XI85_9HEMI|nr:cytochrome c oxidase subunit III [Petalocephala chlorophana]QOH91204.1 cytochrome c oxidase subunit III [Petalocephala chlorophana]